MFHDGGEAPQAQVSAAGIIYVNTYKALAMSEMQRSGIPASIILAQGLHETQAGTSDLVKQSNNHFGIKCKDEWKGATVYHDDDSRGECFRSYPSAEDSYRDHSDFLRNSSRYAFLFSLDPSDFEGWAKGLRKAGYATNIRYSQILIKLVQDYNLQQYSLIALGRLKPMEEVVLTLPDGTTGALALQGVQANGDKGKDPSFLPVSVSIGGANGAKTGGQDSGSQAVTGSAQQPSYPEGEFTINKARVIFAKAGVSLLSVAGQYEMPLSRLLEFNDMKEEDVLVKDQLLFLQRKRRVGAHEVHIVQDGENVYDICQAEGIRMQDLLDMNQLSADARPAAGEKIYLQASAPSRPRLAMSTN
jgi:hypothetical protein